MKSLFDSTSIKNVELKNRLIRSATWENMATEQGHITEKLYNLYEELSKGGVALIISSYATVFEYDKPSANMLGIYDDSFIEEYKKLTEMVHKNNCKVVMQIVHGKEYKNEKTGLNSYDFSDKMTKEDIDSLIKAFRDSAIRVKKSGFDGIQIHCAHGYFLGRTLSPIYNTRTDFYGGTVENRANLIIKVYDEIRKAVGEDFNIFIKINCSDFQEGGATFKECEYVCRELDKKGIDAIEISGGGAVWKKELQQEGIFKEYANKIAKDIKAPVILVGLNRSVASMTNILSSMNIEYFSMSRPFICEPNLVNKWLSSMTTKSRCISCGKCVTEKGIKCVFNR